MAVALRGYTQGTSQASGSVAITWPTGTIAGDLAVLFAHDGEFRLNRAGGPTTSGWVGAGEGAWVKKVTAADLASALPVNGVVTFLQTFTGAARIDSVRQNNGLRVQQAGSGLLVTAYGPAWLNFIVPGATERLGNHFRSATFNKLESTWFKTAASAGWVELTGGRDWDSNYYAYEIVPSTVPSAPVVIAPISASQTDTTQPVVFTWLHQSNSNADQDGAQIKVRAVGSGTWSYVQSAGTITTTTTTMTQTAQAATINAGVLTTGTQYEFTIATREFGSMGAASSLSTFTPANKPTVNTITPTATIESLTPSIAWTATMGLGSQDAWQVRVSPSADPNSETPLWDSGVVQGNTTTTAAPANAGWTNGQTLYAWVRVLQTGGLWSPWTKSASTFAVTWTPPAAPTSVVAANVAGQPLQATVSGIGAGYDLTIEMSVDGGENWAPVNTLKNPGTPVVAQIPLAGYGISTIFRARTSVTLSDVVVLYSAWVQSAALASTDTSYYLVSVDGNQFFQVRMVQDAVHRTAQGVSITYGHGATRARQDQTVAMGESGATTIQARTLNEENAIISWLTAQGTWWLRWGPERGPTLTDKPATRMALAAPIESNRVAQFNTAYRNITFSWVEQ
jgi:hypothetical protein